MSIYEINAKLAGAAETAYAFINRSDNHLGYKLPSEFSISREIRHIRRLNQEILDRLQAASEQVGNVIALNKPLGQQFETEVMGVLREVFDDGMEHESAQKAEALIHAAADTVQAEVRLQAEIDSARERFLGVLGSMDTLHTATDTALRAEQQTIDLSAKTSEAIELARRGIVTPMNEDGLGGEL